MCGGGGGSSMIGEHFDFSEWNGGWGWDPLRWNFSCESTDTTCHRFSCEQWNIIICIFVTFLSIIYLKKKLKKCSLRDFFSFFFFLSFFLYNVLNTKVVSRLCYISIYHKLTFSCLPGARRGKCKPAMLIYDWLLTGVICPQSNQRVFTRLPVSGTHYYFAFQRRTGLWQLGQVCFTINILSVHSVTTLNL